MQINFFLHQKKGQRIFFKDDFNPKSKTCLLKLNFTIVSKN